MSGFLIDTNVVSELRKGRRANPGVANWFHREETSEMWLSVLVVGELRRGVGLLRRRDPRAADSLNAWLDAIVSDFGDRVLPVSEPITARWATITIPDPVPAIDGLLAATDLEHRLTLATRNVADVKCTGVQLVNPFTVP